MAKTKKKSVKKEKPQAPSKTKPIKFTEGKIVLPEFIEPNFSKFPRTKRPRTIEPSLEESQSSWEEVFIPTTLEQSLENAPATATEDKDTNVAYSPSEKSEDKDIYSSSTDQNQNPNQVIQTKTREPRPVLMGEIGQRISSNPFRQQTQNIELIKTDNMGPPNQDNNQPKNLNKAYDMETREQRDIGAGQETQEERLRKYK